MRVNRQVRDDNHERIVDGASRLLRERGIPGTSVVDVMQEAGLTHGGFYRHFANKDVLVTAAIDAAFDALLGELESAPSAAALRELQSRYLDDGHIRAVAAGCPMPALAVDVSRASPAVKEAFAKQVERVLRLFAADVSHTADADADAGAGAHGAPRLAMLVGAVVLARACDEATAQRLLRACRAVVERDTVTVAVRAPDGDG